MRQMEWRQRRHVVGRSDVEGLVGEIGSHESPQSLDHGTSRVAVKVHRQPRVRKTSNCGK